MFHQIRFTSQKIAQRLGVIEPLVYRRRAPLPAFRCLLLPDPASPPPVGQDVDDSAWPLVGAGEYWGERLASFVLRARFSLPADWDPTQAYAFYLPLGISGEFSHPEALAYIDGQAWGSCDRHHQELRLPPGLFDGQTHLLALHGWAGLYETDPLMKLLMRQCELVQVDLTTRRFTRLARAALGIADILPDSQPERGHIYTALNEAFQALDTRDPLDEAFYASLPAAQAVLEEGLRRAGPPLNVDIIAAGHAHIDVAWLWTLAQTHRKASRTFYNVLRLMEEYPEFQFSQSQPQLYEFIRQDDPALFEQIRQRVDEGRWEALGGMWVEADCNLSGSEPLARQFLLGRSFFRRHFGAQAESPVLWLPDVFGYAWNLPQLIKESGLEYFFTIKIGWSQYNRLPYGSFWWQGLDGTRVLTHFSSTPDTEGPYDSTYNADVSPAQVLGSWTNAKQKDWNHPGSVPPVLMAYGFGDGGGGPTREMIENIRILGDFPATPSIHPGRVGDFFRQLERESGERLPVWNGELYLELHRGTYTTQSRNKRANRQSEFLLHDAEFLASLATQLDPDYALPRADLQQAWELMCLNQFHDILPGSSIAAVYTESLAQYAHIRQLAESVMDQAMQTISIHTPGDVLLINTTSFEQSGLVVLILTSPSTPPRSGEGSLPPLPLPSGEGWGEGAPLAGSYLLPSGLPIPAQPVAGGLLLAPGSLPPYSINPLTKSAGAFPLPPNPLIARPDLLENEHLRVELNPAGDIVRIFDKVNRREVMPAGALANQFQAFEDRPVNWDAWDLDIFYDDRMWTAEPAESVRVVESGPLRASLEIQRRILHSSYIQRISLEAGSPRLDFSTSIDWNEHHILLKTAFPLDVLSPSATYEVQWGNVERPTHRNSSWDWARFETCAHKWVDLSEGDYGASLLNDCKYGHDIRDNVIRLSLLRSPTNPDPGADQGTQTFAYSLLPHAGRWGEQTAAAAYALNDPVRVFVPASPAASASGGVLPSFLHIDRSNVVIETVKPAEDGHGIIVRLYEYQRQRGHVRLSTGFPLSAAWRTNLIEEDVEQLPCTADGLSVEIKPYQILTVRLIP